MTNRRLATALVVSALATCWPGATLSAAAAQLADGREAFEIDLPADCQIMTKGPTIDFEVFYVTCKDVTYAGVYAGNAADRQMPRSRLLKTSLQWPSEIQVWSLVVPNDQARADLIAASVRLRPHR